MTRLPATKLNRIISDGRLFGYSGNSNKGVTIKDYSFWQEGHGLEIHHKGEVVGYVRGLNQAKGQSVRKWRDCAPNIFLMVVADGHNPKALKSLILSLYGE